MSTPIYSTTALRLRRGKVHASVNDVKSPSRRSRKAVCGIAVADSIPEWGQKIGRLFDVDDDLCGNCYSAEQRAEIRFLAATEFTLVAFGDNVLINPNHYLDAETAEQGAADLAGPNWREMVGVAAMNRGLFLRDGTKVYQ